MAGGWLVSYILLWILVLLLAVVVLTHSRLLGMLHHRFGPAGARQMADGPEIGSRSEHIFGKQLDGQRRSWKFPLPADLIAIFISPQCQTCNALLPHVKDFARENEKPGLVLVSTLGDLEMNRAYVAYQQLEKLSYIINEKLADEFAIEGTPYAVYFNGQGIVSAKGLVNNYENLVGLTVTASQFKSRLAQSHAVSEKENIP